MVKRVNKFDYKKWLKEIVPNKDGYLEFNEVVNSKGKTIREIVYIYTYNNKYAIRVVWEDGKPGNIGCSVSCRKPRAGEDWTRGNDLPDGPYSYKTWLKIKDAIIKYELVKLVEPPKAVEESVEEVEGEDKL